MMSLHVKGSIVLPLLPSKKKKRHCKPDALCENTLFAKKVHGEGVKGAFKAGEICGFTLFPPKGKRCGIS